MRKFYLLAILGFLTGFVPSVMGKVAVAFLAAVFLLIIAFFILVALCVSGDPANKGND